MAATGPTMKRGKSAQDIETPWEFIAHVRPTFGDLTLDLACTRDNCKASQGLYYPAIDALSVPWAKLLSGGIGWLNPPFDPIEPWAKKCADEAANGAKILLLHRLAADSNWFWQHIWPNALVYALTPRLKFDGQKDVYPFPLALSTFNIPLPDQTHRNRSSAFGWRQLYRWHWKTGLIE